MKTRTIAVLMLAALAGCDNLSIGNGVRPETMQIVVNGDSEDGELFECLASSPQLLLTFSNGSVGDFVRRASWSSSDESVVMVSDGTFEAPNGGIFLNGAALPVAPGTATLRAEYVGLSAEIEVTVSPIDIALSPVEQVLVDGSSLTLQATGILDGRDALRAANLFGEGIWSVAGAAGGDPVTEIDPAEGLLNAPEGVAGTDMVNFEIPLCDRSASVPLTVIDQELVGLSVDLADGSQTGITELLVPEDVSTRLRITGHYDGGHSQDFTGVASVSLDPVGVALYGLRGTGVLTTLVGAEVGSVIELTASFDPDSSVEDDEIVADVLTLTVADATLDPDSLAIAPLDPLMLPGTGLQFTASGQFSGPDGEFTPDLTRDLVWESSDSLLVSISNVNGSRGFALSAPGDAGQVTIAGQRLNDDAPETAPSTVLTSGAQVDEDGEEFNPVQLVSLRIESGSGSTASRGETLRLSAIGTLENGVATAEQDLSLSVVWTSDDESLAVVSNASGLRGRVTPVSDAADAQVTIRAAWFNRDVQEERVVAETVLTLNPTPADDGMPEGEGGG